MNMQIILATAAITTVLTTGAFAADNIDLSDLNSDGVISAEEIRAQVQAHRSARMTQFDIDGNGELSDVEKSAMRNTRQAERLATADADGDGVLSPEERRAARAAQRAAMRAQLDIDGDGVVSAAESAGFEEYLQESGGKHGRGHGNGGKGY